jgi:hypothetical protein
MKSEAVVTFAPLHIVKGSGSFESDVRLKELGRAEHGAGVGSIPVVVEFNGGRLIVVGRLAKAGAAKNRAYNKQMAMVYELYIENEVLGLETVFLKDKSCGFKSW